MSVLAEQSEAAHPIVEQHRDAFAKIDALEVEMMKLPAVDLPVTHTFTPGLYTRTIFMPAGTLLTSKVHKTEHPFVIHAGLVEVFDDDNGPQVLGPGLYITKPGTRRVLRILADTLWSTFHPTTETDLAKVEELLILKHDAHRAGLVQPSAPAIEGVPS